MTTTTTPSEVGADVTPATLSNLLADELAKRDAAQADAKAAFHKLLERADVPEANDGPDLLKLAQALGIALNQLAITVQQAVEAGQHRRRVAELNQQATRLREQVDELQRQREDHATALADAGGNIDQLHREVDAAVVSANLDNEELVSQFLRARGWVFKGANGWQHPAGGTTAIIAAARQQIKADGLPLRQWAATRLATAASKALGRIVPPVFPAIT